jgi:UDP-2,3-diacylglucosamine pyrophosphatase LpxH
MKEVIPMYFFQRLTKVYQDSPQMEFDDAARFILISDCHRGDNSPGDNFAPNEPIFLQTLEYYYNHGFTCFELGDSDDLWENPRFSLIKKSHPDSFRMLSRFFRENRYYMLLGNHDRIKKNRNFRRRNLSYLDPQQRETLFPGIEPYASLILHHRPTGLKIFLSHGHYGDLMNDLLWRFSCWLVRYLWRPLEIRFKFTNPISPAKNPRKKHWYAALYSKWATDNQQAMIVGHLHHSAFPLSGQAQYFNTGCCVFRDCITGIEIVNGAIALVEWNLQNDNGQKRVVRNVVGGPTKLVHLAKAPLAKKSPISRVKPSRQPIIPQTFRLMFS